MADDVDRELDPAAAGQALSAFLASRLAPKPVPKATTKPCAMCPRLIPNTPRHTTCSRACRRRHRQQLFAGRQPAAAAIVGRQAQARRAIEDRMRATFGPTLSARDVALFRAAMKLGYDRGYSAGSRRKAGRKF